MRKLQLREVTSASKWQSWDLNKPRPVWLHGSLWPFIRPSSDDLIPTSHICYFLYQGSHSPPPLRPCPPGFSSDTTFRRSSSWPPWYYVLCPLLPPQTCCITLPCLISFISHTHCLKLSYFFIHLPVYFLSFLSVYHEGGGTFPSWSCVPSS